MITGRLGYNSANDRYGLLVSDLWEHDGFHCGGVEVVLLAVIIGGGGDDYEIRIPVGDLAIQSGG